MRRFTAGLTLIAALVTLLALPLASAGRTPTLIERLKTGVNNTLGGVNDVVVGLREQERRRRARQNATPSAQPNVTPRAATPPGYNPPLHGQNPHGQGTPTTVDLPASSLRPMPANPAGGNGEILVVGRARGEQNPNGTYHGHITIVALGGDEVVGVDTTPGQTRAGPLDAAQQGLLDPLCDASADQICLEVLAADSTTSATGSANRFSVVGAVIGGPAGVTAEAIGSNGNISQDANCQMAHGDSHVTNASIGAFTVDAVNSTSDSRECKDGTRTQTNTSSVVGLGAVDLEIPFLVPAGCGAGVPNTPALIPGLLPAVCNADESNGAQADAPYGVREGLTAFVADLMTTALIKTTTGASESRARMKAQCSDGIDNDGDGQIDFPNDPDCTGPTDDSEAGGARPTTDDESDEEGARNRADCEDGRDNDGDGLVDFPEDPGCTSRSDDSEENAGAAGPGGGRGDAAECSDGIDNDGDGKVDFPDDPGCESASDDSEEDGIGGSLPFTGTNLVLMFLAGSLVLLVGLTLRSLTGRRASRRRGARLA